MQEQDRSQLNDGSRHRQRILTRNDHGRCLMSHLADRFNYLRNQVRLGDVLVSLVEHDKLVEIAAVVSACSKDAQHYNEQAESFVLFNPFVT